MNWSKIARYALPLWFGATLALPTDDCPLLGPVLPYNFDPASTEAFENATSLFPELIDSLFASGDLNETYSSITIDVFSTSTNASVYSYHHTASGLNGSLTANVLDDGTIFRTGSVSKLFTVYAIIVNGGLEVLNHPVTKYIPELAGNPRDDPIRYFVWEDITVGALASQQGGAGSFPTTDTTCFITGNCSVESFLDTMKNTERPTTPPYGTVLYADAGFGLLGRVLERMTNLSYAEALETTLSTPLGLNGTSTVRPDYEGVNGLIVPGELNVSSWGFDNQISAPSGGVYSNNADLRTLGLSILHSQLLSPATTRAWMKPLGSVATLIFNVGAPWEIHRAGLPVSPGSSRTRVSDLYTKSGGNAGYGTIFGLSPDHGLGFSIFVAGPSALSDRWPLRDAVAGTFMIAAEHAAFESAMSNFAGTFVDDSIEGNNITITVDADHPGLGIESLYLGGIESRGLIVAGTVLDVPAANLSVRMYPMELNTQAEEATQMEFRAVPRLSPSRPPPALEGGQGLFDYRCTNWFSIDTFAVDGLATDSLTVDVVNGRAEAIRYPVAGTVMQRVS